MNTTKPTEAAIRAAKAIRDAEPNLMIKSQEDIAQIIDREFAEVVSSMGVINSIIGNVDHSKGNGASIAKMRGDMLNDIRAISGICLAKLNAK